MRGKFDTLLIASGNPLRGDDGVAALVLDLAPRGFDYVYAHQLTPEIAAGLNNYRRVIFIDADLGADAVRIERVAGGSGSQGLGHVVHAQQVVALARRLFGFQGHAYLCRIPVRDVSAREGLSDAARERAGEAAHLIARKLSVPIN